MVELIAAKGYPAVRISDLARLAHVSPPTLYEIYSDKEELFLGTYEELTGRAAVAILGAYESESRPRLRLDAAMRGLRRAGGIRPPGVSLLVQGAFGAGEKALERRGHNLQRLERPSTRQSTRAAGSRRGASLRSRRSWAGSAR